MSEQPTKDKRSTDVETIILSRVGGRVAFQYPADEGNRLGILKDRVVVKSTTPPGGVPYWDVVDLIQFDQEPEPWMRMGYYRKPRERLNWASQTTITEPISVWKRLLAKAGRDKKWFRDLLSEVMRELHDSTSASS